MWTSVGPEKTAPSAYGRKNIIHVPCSFGKTIFNETAPLEDSNELYDVSLL